MGDLVAALSLAGVGQGDLVGLVVTADGAVGGHGERRRVGRPGRRGGGLPTRRSGPGGRCGRRRRRGRWRGRGSGWRRAGMSRRCTGCCSAGGGPTRSTRGPACTGAPPTRCPRWPARPTCSARPTTPRTRRRSARPRRSRRPGCSSPASTEQGGGSRISTARCESTAELLCAELSADGLPVDRAAAEGLLAEITGPRPRGPADAAAIRAARDARVLRHAPAGAASDLRSPVQVKALLAAAGIDVPDTRAGRLERVQGELAACRGAA